ncbi:hypothetical protein GCM10023403_15580 [Pseudonocardia benzenivorans]
MSDPGNEARLHRGSATMRLMPPTVRPGGRDDRATPLRRAPAAPELRGGARGHRPAREPVEGTAAAWPHRTASRSPVCRTPSRGIVGGSIWPAEQPARKGDG